MTHENIVIKPDYREYIAEDLGWIFLFILSLASIPVAQFFDIKPISIGIGLISCVLAVLLIIKYVWLTAVTWIITEDQICRVQGVFTNKIDYVELYRVVDYTESQTFLQKILKVKTVTIVSTDKSECVLDIFGMSKNLNLVSRIRQRVEQCKQERRIYEITNR